MYVLHTNCTLLLEIFRPSAGSFFMYVLWEFDDTIMVIGKQELIMNAHVCLCRRSLTLTLGSGPQWVEINSEVVLIHLPFYFPCFLQDKVHIF